MQERLSSRESRSTERQEAQRKRQASVQHSVK
jgi:hypothetical protein